MIQETHHFHLCPSDDEIEELVRIVDGRIYFRGMPIKTEADAAAVLSLLLGNTTGTVDGLRRLWSCQGEPS